MDLDVAIVGAGAAGLATAIFAARRLPGVRIATFDGARRLGAKILVAGGGRCNVTNRQVTPEDFCGGSRNSIRKVLATLTVPQTVAFFREIGVDLHEEEHGKLFPDTNRARTVLDALLEAARQLGVGLHTGYRAQAVEHRDGVFVLSANQGPVTSRHLVLATGGMSLPKTGSDGGGYALARSLGHTIVAPSPALVPLVLDGTFHAPLSGVSQEVELCLRAGDAKPVHVHGAMLWTHFGISGPAVLDISRHWHRARLHGHEATLAANLLPGDDLPAAEQRFLELSAAQPRTALRSALGTLLPVRVADAVLAHLGIDPHVPLAHLPREARRRLLTALVAWPLPVRDSRGFAHAEVTAGGVPLKEIDPATMASRRCTGLQLVGEILDVDGCIGGFNFQWAWSSAYAAAAGLAREVGHAIP